jgi:hypothetical protein
MNTRNAVRSIKRDQGLMTSQDLCIRYSFIRLLWRGDDVYACAWSLRLTASVSESARTTP